jgi:CRISPR-associated protein Cas2
MHYLICYDISDNKLRDKVHNKLLFTGLSRVQYSVFMGETDEKHISSFILWFRSKTTTLAFGSDIGLIVLRLTLGHVQNMEVFGNKSIDIDELSGEKSTLII